MGLYNRGLNFAITMKYTVSSPSTLHEFLCSQFPNASKSSVKKWIEEGRVIVCGRKILQTHYSLKPGQTAEFRPKSVFLREGVEILFQDADVVIIEKPYGLLSVATAFETGLTAHAILKRHFAPRPVHVVHRIDQETSGVMMFALSERGKNKFKELFAAHQLERQYIAIVEGILETQEGTWESWLREDAAYKVHVVDNPQEGERAVTHYLLVNQAKKFSKLLLTLETGRKNQIRVHCQKAGHPVVGDRKYGAHYNPIHRLALHACRLAFMHPFTGKPMHFESVPPGDFDKLVK
jgi:23S rRNA pseudouridine1911/1915/1917 synthase